VCDGAADAAPAAAIIVTNPSRATSVAHIPNRILDLPKIFVTLPRGTVFPSMVADAGSGRKQFGLEFHLLVPWFGDARAGTMRSTMRIAYFTGGDVGAGHLMRGLAVGRALRRAGVAAEYRMFGPQLRFPIISTLDYEVVPLVPAELRDAALAPSSALGRAITAYAPDLLIADLYWAPLRHLLPIAGCEAWLLVRSCPPAWFGGPPDARFDPRLFARIIGIEPVHHDALTEHVDPVVVCNADECRPAGALRSHLGVAPGAPLVVITHAGVPGEIDQLADSASASVVRFDLHGDAALFPLAEWLGDADAVIAGAGYNSFWEAQWLGWAPRTTFTPFPRKIDDQAWRIGVCGWYRMRANGADTLAEWVRAG
jgi:hypothetical protein